ncbi:hypothetical protein HC256_008567 [Beauveria bassiana]|nr:hypothetical protein HC256_008567 [Beauveria bassiana]
MGDSVQLSAASAPKRYALPTDWDQHKETIRRLYLDENEPLKEVMAIMGRDYGHFGSIKQYKNKLREWGFDTKYKRHQPSRKRKYKRPSRQSVDAFRAVDYLSNAPSVEDDDDQACQAAFAQGTSTLSATRQVSTDFNKGRQASHRHRTYRASSCTVGIQVGRSATPPMSLPERIFSLAQQHIETSFTYEVWKVVDGNVQTITARTKGELELPESYFDLVRSAVLLFEQGSTVDGCHVLSKAFALVRPILKNGNRGHPVAQMFKLLTQIDVLELEHLVHNAWQITTDAFQKQLPNLHPEYVRHQCDLIFRIYGKRDALTAERRLCQLLKNCEDTAQTLEISHLTVLNALGYNFMNSKDWVKAVNIGQKLEERAQLAQDIDLLVYQIGGMEIQARAFNELKLTMPAVKCLKQATRLIADEWGKTDPWRIELMALQQLYLREGGEIKEAADLQAEISRITERIDADWDAQN